jgi:glucosylceramidase
MTGRIIQAIRLLNISFIALLAIATSGCKSDDGINVTPPPPSPPGVSDMEVWLTTPDRNNLFTKQSSILTWGTPANNNVIIGIDSTQKYQSVDGFGYTLTGGSADVIMAMNAADRGNLLKELFATDAANIGVSYLRLSIGASDLSATVFSYDDLPAGQTDPTLAGFSLSKDTVNLIPLLKEILLINPAIKILATPWSPPVWMKDNNSSTGGSLLPQYYATYANYFVKYIQAMKAKGITIDAVTVQNEPEHGGNNPSMTMTAAQQAAFIKNNLGPAFQTAGITTKIIAWDHNCDHPSFPIEVLNDAGARQYIDGSAFHLYAGDISALSTVRAAHPDRNLYFTEQYTAANGDFGGDLKWHLKNVIIGSMRNWSRNALEWNLATDPSYGPHTVGGCNSCKGALTIGPSVTKNVSYYIIAHAAKFVRPGSIRIESNNIGNLQNVAFLAPDGSKVLLVENDSNSPQTFNIKYNNKWVSTSIAAGAVATFVWK